jgi:hypothetical protein
MPYKDPEKHKEWTRKFRNPEINRRYFLKKRYGITPKVFQEMLATQGGGCAICGELHAPLNNGTGKGSLQVDHNHTTNVVRELLCGNCNNAIGHVKESPERARQIAAYLERHNHGKKL